MSDGHTISGHILKANDDLRRITGWASVTSKGGAPVVDREGDVIQLDDMRDAVEEFMDSARNGGYMHERNDDGDLVAIGKVVDSFIIDADIAKAIGMDTDVEGWLVTIKVDNAHVWAMVKSGEIGGFSIGFRGYRESA